MQRKIMKFELLTKYQIGGVIGKFHNNIWKAQNVLYFFFDQMHHINKTDQKIEKYLGIKKLSNLPLNPPV